MKLEIEIDENRIYEEVIKKLYEQMRHELGHKIEQAIKGEIVTVMLIEIREVVKKKIPFLKLEDGRTIEDYVNDILFKKSSSREEDRWRGRSRIQQIIDDQIYQNACDIFTKLVEPYVQELREGILKNVTEILLGKIKAAS